MHITALNDKKINNTLRELLILKTSLRSVMTFATRAALLTIS